RTLLGPSAAALVPPRGDGHGVAAGDARVAVGDPGVVAPAASPGRALPVADRVVVAGGAVLLDPQRQARCLHPARAADGLPRTGAVAAGHPAPARRAAIAACLHAVRVAAGAGRGREHAARRPALRTEAGDGPRHRRAAAASGGLDAGGDRLLGPGLRALVRAPARRGGGGRDASRPVGGVRTGRLSLAQRFQFIARPDAGDRKSTRLNSSHVKSSYAV